MADAVMCFKAFDLNDGGTVSVDELAQVRGAGGGGRRAEGRAVARAARLHTHLIRTARPRKLTYVSTSPLTRLPPTRPFPAASPRC